MHRVPGVLCVGLLLVLAAARPVFAEGPSAIWFSKVSPDQELRIKFESRGCAHQTQFLMVYSVHPEPRISVTSLGERGVIDPKTEEWRIESGRQELGTATFTPGGVARLDNLLRFYRKKSKGACTTINNITFTLLENGRTLRTETYEDDTCRPYVLDASPEHLTELKIKEPPVISLERIVAALDQADRRGEALVVVPEIDPSEDNEAAGMVAMQRQEEKSKVLARSLPGSTEFLREWTIEDTYLGYINFAPYSLHVQLKARRQRLVDAAWWWNPAEDDVPALGWSDFTAVHSELERAVLPHTWLREWKARGKKHGIEAHIVGKRPNDEDDIDSFVLPAWRHAGLTGQPYYAILLRRAGKACGTLWFGKDESRALITDADPFGEPSSKVPLDRVKVSYHPSQEVPEYVVVHPDGKWEKNTLKDLVTPALLKEEIRKMREKDKSED